eukprot:1982314-Alexandrium_andersonii.AAC.1
MHEKASGRLPEAVSGAVRSLPAQFGASHHACFAEQRLKLPEAAPRLERLCGWLKACGWSAAGG